MACGILQLGHGLAVKIPVRSLVQGQGVAVVQWVGVDGVRQVDSTYEGEGERDHHSCCCELRQNGENNGETTSK